MMHSMHPVKLQSAQAIRQGCIQQPVAFHWQQACIRKQSPNYSQFSDLFIPNNSFQSLIILIMPVVPLIIP